ncbi:hypothetical protein F5J12DRAFT_785569 [Pisolithus orientalis]|uniref:uncharacterized protein n=1 Tax=Pisolithus orientalis TaxID=936130 RepID=UPI0022251A92|nr:uncharacterized protein F5J12DRAFT_785569 [Pisolithus orientalis]KAI5995800.1 hypothetical protein F5J12DRAFT_785569 [Pisolithus orientalis]
MLPAQEERCFAYAQETSTYKVPDQVYLMQKLAFVLMWGAALGIEPPIEEVAKFDLIILVKPIFTTQMAEPTHHTKCSHNHLHPYMHSVSGSDSTSTQATQYFSASSGISSSSGNTQSSLVNLEACIISIAWHHLADFQGPMDVKFCNDIDFWNHAECFLDIFPKLLPHIMMTPVIQPRLQCARSQSVPPLVPHLVEALPLLSSQAKIVYQQVWHVIVVVEQEMRPMSCQTSLENRKELCRVQSPQSSQMPAKDTSKLPWSQSPNQDTPKSPQSPKTVSFAGVDVGEPQSSPSPSDSSLTSLEFIELTTKIQKPPSESQGKTWQQVIHTAVKKYLNMTKSRSYQDSEAVQKVTGIARQWSLWLEDYEHCWPILDMIHLHLKYLSSRHWQRWVLNVLDTASPKYLVPLCLESIIHMHPTLTYSYHPHIHLYALLFRWLLHAIFHVISYECLALCLSGYHVMLCHILHIQAFHPINMHGRVFDWQLKTLSTIIIKYFPLHSIYCSLVTSSSMTTLLSIEPKVQITAALLNDKAFTFLERFTCKEFTDTTLLFNLDLIKIIILNPGGMGINAIKAVQKLEQAKVAPVVPLLEDAATWQLVLHWATDNSLSFGIFLMEMEKFSNRYQFKKWKFIFDQVFEASWEGTAVEVIRAAMAEHGIIKPSSFGSLANHSIRQKLTQIPPLSMPSEASKNEHEDEEDKEEDEEDELDNEVDHHPRVTTIAPSGLFHHYGGEGSAEGSRVKVHQQGPVHNVKDHMEVNTNWTQPKVFKVMLPSAHSAGFILQHFKLEGLECKTFCSVPCHIYVEAPSSLKNEIAYVQHVEGDSVYILIIPWNLPYISGGENSVVHQELSDVDLAYEHGLEVTLTLSPEGHTITHCLGSQYHCGLLHGYFQRCNVEPVNLPTPEKIAWFIMSGMDPTLVTCTLTCFSAQRWQVGDHGKIQAREFVNKIAYIAIDIQVAIQ